MVVVERIRRRVAAAKPAKSPAPIVRPMSRPEIAAELASVKEQARRLRPPLNMRPDAFHEDKSELVRAIERLEDAVRLNRPIEATS